MSPACSRRALLLATGAAMGAALLLPRRPPAATQPALVRSLTPGPGRAPLVGGAYPDTAVWAFDGQVPGPILRARQGERVRVEVVNALAETTTVHWHGLRVPNAMDGVPQLTQEPIAPGARFVYEFELPDAGTYWYHPHISSPEQVGRGLYGAFIVDEPRPPPVDRDLVWILDDWRLDQQAQITDDFLAFHDLSHNGRLGNTVTINGRQPQTLEVRPGERLRLRLINAANARVFALELEGHAPSVIALDGQPVTPHAPADGRVVLAPAQRADLILDCDGAPGSRHRILDSWYQRDIYLLSELVYGETAAEVATAREPVMLPANPLPTPDLGAAERHRVEFGGGMMDPKLQRGEVSVEALRERFRAGGIWTVNGEPRLHHDHAPLLTFRRGAQVVLELVNDSQFDHPIHLHGHSFQVLSVNSAAQSPVPWRDTVLMAPGERIEIAFVADNPGDWMFHCHILEHQVSGMMATIRVA